MKKFYSLLLACCFIPAFAAILPAQSNPQNDPEKIYLFDADISVHENGSITVTENITVNVKHQRINRGIYRDIPVSLKESVRPVSLQLDGQEHPFFTERKDKNLRINFGNDDYISTGKHTYTFVYTFVGAIDFYREHDEIYWNVTGNDWDFMIDKARVRVRFPDSVHVLKSGISLYTGPTGSKRNDTQETAKFTYETTRALAPHEGLTVAIPFDKGAVQKPSVLEYVKNSLSLPAYQALIILAVLCLYCWFTWFTLGKDPYYLAVTQYEPPEGISPAFMNLLYTLEVDESTLACQLVDMGMKGILEIHGVGSTDLKLTLKKVPANPSPEEDFVLKQFFPNEQTSCVLKENDKTSANKVKSVLSNLGKYLKKSSKDYIIYNKLPLYGAALLFIASGIIPFLHSEIIAGNIIYLSPILLSFGLKQYPLLGMRIVLIALSIGYVFGTYKDWTAHNVVCVLCFMICMWVFTYYGSLIRNLTPAGKILFAHIDGFRKYMETAEASRVAASDPLKAEQIFCKFLPFAFALQLQSEWLKQFTTTLSKETLHKCTSCIGGMRFISSGLANRLEYASGGNSSKGGKGSFGGGFSGGGHGGGGGGGR